MLVPPLHLDHHQQFYISGDVTIHPTAAIALGVILQANPDSKIIIGSGVCIGMGAILHASGGTLVIEAGANLGAGVLMLGTGKIGANATIGATTTIWNCSVAAGQVVPPGSLLGDTSRQITESPTTKSEPQPPELFPSIGVSPENPIKVEEAQNSEIITQEEQSHATLNGTLPHTDVASQVEEPDHSAGSSATNTEESSIIIGAQIYGQGNIKRLLSTLFPHTQTLRQSLDEDKSE